MRFGRVKRRARLFWLGCALSIVGTITVASAETVIPWDEAETLERLATVLDRLADVTERMAAAEDRMEAVLAQLEQRETALALAQASQAPPPPPPASYGEPQPRPAYEALRTVKRGMSRNEVQRLIGDPSFVEPSGGGWTTWYYGYGRSISFDARGRATALVGFPPP